VDETAFTWLFLTVGGYLQPASSYMSGQTGTCQIEGNFRQVPAHSPSCRVQSAISVSSTASLSSDVLACFHFFQDIKSGCVDSASVVMINSLSQPQVCTPIQCSSEGMENHVLISLFLEFISYQILRFKPIHMHPYLSFLTACMLTWPQLCHPHCIHMQNISICISLYDELV
jgi:hypothetical protein